MRAIVYEEYGPPEVLELRDVATPVARDNKILIRVHAASVNASDWETLVGKPLYVRVSGLRRPSQQIPGSDVAGTVEAVGDDVELFRPGDEVFGDLIYSGGSTFAEYVCVPETAPIVKKPPGMTFGEAAALPQAAGIALQGLDRGEAVREGDRVLINGAGGGAGTLALQIAKAAGAEVTGVDNGLKGELLRSLGADHVVDYTQEDFAKTGRRYDRILDLASHRSIFASRRALSQQGTYLMVGGSMAAVVQAGLLGPVVSRIGSKTARLLMVKPNKDDLSHMGSLVAAGSIRPVIDRTYPLEEAADALRHLGEGRALGKVVVTVVPEDGR